MISLMMMNLRSLWAPASLGYRDSFALSQNNLRNNSDRKEGGLPQAIKASLFYTVSSKTARFVSEKREVLFSLVFKKEIKLLRYK